jgi:hypothetical protein
MGHMAHVNGTRRWNDAGESWTVAAPAPPISDGRERPIGPGDESAELESSLQSLQAAPPVAGGLDDGDEDEGMCTHEQSDGVALTLLRQEGYDEGYAYGCADGLNAAVALLAEARMKLGVPDLGDAVSLAVQAAAVETEKPKAAGGLDEPCGHFDVSERVGISGLAYTTRRPRKLRDCCSCLAAAVEAARPASCDHRYTTTYADGHEACLICGTIIRPTPRGPVGDAT